MRVIITFIILFCCFLSISVYADYEVPEKLVVGYNSELPPFSYQDQTRQPVGFTIDLMNEIAANHGIEIIYEPVKERELINKLERGEIDVILGVKYNSTLAEIVDFTESVFTLSDSLFVFENDNSIYSLTDLNKSVVALSVSSSMDTLDHIRDVKVNVAGSQPNALQMFLSGRSDAYIGNPWTTEFLLGEQDQMDNIEERVAAIQSYELSFAVSKGQIGLTSLINLELAKLKADKTFQQIHNKWFQRYKADDSWLKKLAIFLAITVNIALLVIFIVFLLNQRLKKEVAKKTTALTRSFLFQEQVLNSVDTGIISFHKTGKIRLMNEEACNLLQGDFINRNMEDVTLLCEIWRRVQGDPLQKKFVGESKLEANNSTERMIHYEVVPLKNEDSRSVGWIVTLVDITEQKLLQQKLMVQEKLKALGQLTAGIAHELRNPLTSMKLFIELLPTKVHDSRFREELIKHVPTEINRLNHLVEDLLDYTRRKEPVTEWIPLKEFLESLLYSFKINVKSKNIAFKLLVDEGIEWHGDRQRIKQVFINLLMNAIEAVQHTEEKVITIATKIDEEYFYIKVTDTGEGISEEDQKNLFQPFFTTKGSGVGLGLYTSYNIVLDHHGDIEVHSEKGVGSTFTIKFRKEDVR
ncbi:transporter substrate-binding domain-containing protein [Calidifontibacillus oryziterrae]|uniref:transporter substrate-binding domain-containing protein n=1 Tax=Calidifontibacillus oryziterrae TaxID=1191699 RepID=UPI0002DB0C74|nr:transporter substrate-binding domain-containing protein [Calidifontibacillus oryziterrae]